MLWAYFDESGEHNKTTGKLVRLTIGGGYSTLEKWQEIERDWSAALNKESVPSFHMTDFEAYRGLFKGWDKPKHQRLLNNLLDAVAIKDMHIVGVSGAVKEENAAFRATYARCIIQSINSAYIGSHLTHNGSERINLAFARTKDFSMQRIAKYCDKIKLGLPNLGTVMTDDPEKLVPLQVADLLAYEISHIDRSPKHRYPFRRLSQGYASFHVRQV